MQLNKYSFIFYIIKKAFSFPLKKRWVLPYRKNWPFKINRINYLVIPLPISNIAHLSAKVFATDERATWSRSYETWSHFFLLRKCSSIQFDPNRTKDRKFPASCKSLIAGKKVRRADHSKWKTNPQNNLSKTYPNKTSIFECHSPENE